MASEARLWKEGRALFHHPSIFGKSMESKRKYGLIADESSSARLPGKEND